MLNFTDPEKSMDLDIVISKFQQIKSGFSVFIEKNEFLDLIDFYLTQNQMEDAIEVLDIAIKLYPDCFELKLTEAQLLIEAGFHKQASYKLKDLYKNHSGDLGLLMLIGINFAKSSIINKSLIFFDKAVNLLENEDQSPILYTISQIFIEIGRYDVASFYLTKAYQINPKDDKTILDLAFCLERTEKLDKSKKLYNAYLKLNPFSTLAWYNLGVVYSKINDNEKAIEAFDFALAIDPNFSSALYNKANIYYNNKNNNIAIECLERFLQLEQNNAQAFYLKGLANFNSDRPKKAAKDLINALKIDKSISNAWYYLSMVYFKCNMLKKAKKSLFKALELENLNSKYWAFAAKLFSSEENYKNADKAYMHTISFDPFEDKYWFDYSEYKSKTNDIPEAISILKTGKEFITNSYLLNIKLSSLNLLLNDTNSALFYLNEAIKINPNATNKLIKIHPDKNQAELLTDSIQI